MNKLSFLSWTSHLFLKPLRRKLFKTRFKMRLMRWRLTTSPLSTSLSRSLMRSKGKWLMLLGRHWSKNSPIKASVLWVTSLETNSMVSRRTRFPPWSRVSMTTPRHFSTLWSTPTRVRYVELSRTLVRSSCLIPPKRFRRSRRTRYRRLKSS